MVTLRNATAGDHPAIVALNAEAVQFTGVMDAARLKKMARATCSLRVIEHGAQIAAVLMGFRKGADYDSPNFLWFDARFDDFVYVDRVIVAPDFRGRNLAGRLYDDFESYARANGVTRIACEVNVAPPNPASLRFHEKRGFREIARQPYGPAKIVAMLMLNL